MFTMLPEFVALLRMASEADAETALEAVLERSTEFFGASYYLQGMRLPPESGPVPPIVISNYPERWRRRYDEFQASQFDPVLRRAKQTTQPFTWDELRRVPMDSAPPAEVVVPFPRPPPGDLPSFSPPPVGGGKGEGERPANPAIHEAPFFQEAAAHGLARGITAPVHGPHGHLTLTCYAAPEPLWHSDAERQDKLTLVLRLAIELHETAVRLVAEPAGSTALTESERRTLRLLAHGLTAEQAAAELKISARTIRYRLDRAVRKMGVKTHREAIVRAVASGAVAVHEYPARVFFPKPDSDE